MIEQVEIYHGAMIARLCRERSDVSISLRQHDKVRSAYVAGERVALYVKYSTKRLSPWSFSFQQDHQSEMHRLHNEFDFVFAILVCGLDGIVCLTWDEYNNALDSEMGAVEWIKASRKPRQKYTLTGSDSRSSFKVGDNDFPSRILRALG